MLINRINANLPAGYYNYAKAARASIISANIEIESSINSDRNAKVILSSIHVLRTEMKSELKTVKEDLIHSVGSTLSMVGSNLSHEATVQTDIQPATTPVELNRIPQVPCFDEKLPESMINLLNEHEDRNLMCFHNGKKTEWTNKMQLTFGKRKYLYGAIVARVTGNEDKESTANAMDLQRKALNMNLAQYLVHLKNEDGKTKKRRRQESAPTLLHTS